MNHFNSLNRLTAYSVRRFVKVSFDIFGVRDSRRKQVRGWTAIKTFLLLQIYLGLCRYACLFTYIQGRIFHLLRVAPAFRTLARVIWPEAIERV